MTRRNVNKFLIILHAVTFGAVFFRIDNFPLTWVPMYSLYKNPEILSVPVGDKPKLKKGLEAVTQSGNVEFISAKDLNIPDNAMRRFYTQRAYGEGPPKHKRERVNLNAINLAMYEFFAPDPRSWNWDSIILEKINKTLERKAGDTDYIVQINVSYDFANFSREDRLRGDLSDKNIKTISRSIKGESK